MNRIFAMLALLFVITSCSKDTWQAQFDAGVKASNIKDYTAAVSQFNAALKIAQTEKGDGEREYMSYYHLAHVYFEQELYPACDSLLNLCIANMRAPDDQTKNKQLFAAVNLLAISQSYQPDQQDASIANYQKALKLAGTIWGEHSRKSASVMENIAGLYRAQKRYPEAIQTLEASLPIWEEIFGKDSDKLILTLDDLGINFMLIDSLKQAEEYFQRAQNIADANSIVDGLTSRRMKFFSDIYAKLGDETKATEYRNQAVKIKDQLQK